MKRISNILSILIVLLFLTPTSVAATTQLPTQTVSGASIELSTSQEQRYLSTMDDISGVFPVNPRTNAFLLYDGDTKWMVFTDQKPQTGHAKVSGTVLSPSELGGGKWGAIIADSVDVTTKGTRTSLEKVRSNPKRYDGELVRITTSYRQLSYTVEGGDGQYVDQQTVANLGGPQSGLVEQPGANARWATLNLSGSEYGDSPSGEIATKFAGQGEVGVDRGDSRFWIDAKTTVDAVVIDSGSKPTFYVADTAVESTPLRSLDEIVRNGEELSGKVVTVESQAFGTRTSSQEFLISVAKCAPGSVTVPMTPPLCVPVPSDSTLHSGILFDGAPQSREEVVLYAGISNNHQNTIVEPEKGTFRVTGRVVSTNQIDSSLPDGYALLIYDMNRVGDLQTTGTGERQVESWNKDVTQKLHAQLNASATSSSGDGENAAVAQDQSTGSSQVKIVDARIVENPIQSGETALVRVSLKNKGQSDGKMKVRLRAGGSEVGSKVVTVPAGESKTTSFRYTPSKNTNSIRLGVNQLDLGLLNVKQSNQQQSSNEQEAGSATQQEIGGSQQSSTGLSQAVASEEVTLASALISIVLSVSGLILGVAWAAKGFPAGSFGDVSGRSFGALQLTGGVVGLLSLSTLGISGSELGVLLAGVIFSTVFCMGWAWTGGKLWRSR